MKGDERKQRAHNSEIHVQGVWGVDSLHAQATSVGARCHPPGIPGSWRPPLPAAHRTLIPLMLDSDFSEQHCLSSCFSGLPAPGCVALPCFGEGWGAEWQFRSRAESKSPGSSQRGSPRRSGTRFPAGAWCGLTPSVGLSFFPFLHLRTFFFFGFIVWFVLSLVLLGLQIQYWLLVAPPVTYTFCSVLIYSNSQWTIISQQRWQYYMLFRKNATGIFTLTITLY